MAATGNITTVWYGQNMYVIQSDIILKIMTWIEILFPLCTYSRHVWTVLPASNACIKYCRRSCEDKNSTTMWHGQNMYVSQVEIICNDDLNPIQFSLCTCSMHVWTVLQALNFRIKYCRKTLRRKEHYHKKWRTYVPKTICLSPLCGGGA